MTRLMEMLGRVLIWTGIAATNVTAGQTHPQVRPRVLAVLRAVLATAGRQGLGFGGVGSRRQMLTRARGRGGCVAPS